jgi:NADH:ubiquinone oxidoreductase subunit 5 (subunit L)/multisubunit Na+/H+ antiporter MnhA subunit
MEAPVPASALIHSATLVSAGIFLILRFYTILDLSFFFHFSLAFVGSLTAFIGGASAAIQTDLKKILAYSTISHCGFLMFLCSLGNFNYVFIYLFIHGFFKAASFLCVGNIIRFSKNYQDIRRMGNYLKFLPGEFFFLSFSLLNLSGLPFFFGFYIKHTLFISFDYFYLKQIVLSFIFISALTGIFYSFKIIFFVFFDNKKARKSIYFDNIKNEKKSIFYTNSSLASNISIFFLIIFAYFISLNYIYIILYKNDTNLDFFSFFGKIQSFFFFNLEENILINFSCFY